jgi:hypothetical protein
MTEQTYLPSSYEIWNGGGDFHEIVCEECAVKFAEENKLVWRGNKSTDSFTEDSEELGAGANCIPSYALGESDSPHSCCGIYLDTNLTQEGYDYLEEREFPEWVKKLYGAVK